MRSVRNWVRRHYPAREGQAINRRLKERELHARYLAVHQELLKACRRLPDLAILYHECPTAQYVAHNSMLYGRTLIRLARWWQTHWADREGRLILHHLEDETNRTHTPGVHATVDQWVQDQWPRNAAPMPFTWTWMSELPEAGAPIILADNLVGARRRNFRHDRPLDKNPDWKAVGALISQLPWTAF